MSSTDSKPTIILFDIVSTCSKPWNPNTWKARTVLNYKRIPYKTIWLSYPDIEPTLKKLGAPPHTTDPVGNPHYMLPALLDTTDTANPVIITDSLKIAEYLDATYPARPVFPKEGRALEYIFEETFNRIVGPTYWRMMLPLAWELLDDRSQAYFKEMSTRWYGSGNENGQGKEHGSENKKLIARPPSLTERDWELLRVGFGKLARFCDRNGDEGEHRRIFVGGGLEPTRSDLIIVAYLAAIVVAAPERWEEDVRHWGGGRWEKLWKVSEGWRVVS